MDHDAAGSSLAEGSNRASVDARALAVLGHEQALTRKFSLFSMCSLVFCVLGTWAVFAQNLGAALATGASVSIFWSLLIVLACNLCIATSLGELCSSMPTALGQAYWVSRLWPGQGGRVLSYFCASINTFGWWALTASQNAFMTDMVLGVKLISDPDWPGAGQGWTQFVVFVGITVLFTAFNAISCRSDKTLPYFNNFVASGFVILFIAISLAILIAVGTKPELYFQSGSFVFGTWINQTGWPDGVTWFMGLLQSAYGLTAFDAVIHLVEEMPSPGRNVPKAMQLALICGATSGFIFMVACLFCIQDLDDVINAPSGFPFIELMVVALGRVGGTVLTLLFIFNGFGQGISVLTSASRLTWSFARDGGIPWSLYFSRVDPTWMVPLRALWLQCGIICLIGILYLFSNAALNAILAVSTIGLTISYAIPIATLLAVGREKLPPRDFSLGKFGPVANWVSIVYCAVTTVFFFFPSAPHVAATDMNYAIAVFGVLMVASLIYWMIRGHSIYLSTNESARRALESRQMEVETYEGVGPHDVDKEKHGNGASFHHVRITLETGGKSPFVVFEDADIEQAVKWVFIGSMSNQGQVCTATSRLLVHKSIDKEFVSKLVDMINNIVKIGDPFAEGTLQGRQVSEQQYEKLLGFLRATEDDGAVLECGGRSARDVAGKGKGFFIAPTVFSGVSSKMRIFHEEAFGPAMSVTYFNTDEESLPLANDSIYGLAAAIFTKNMERGHNFSAGLQAGMVWVNSSNDSNPQVPFGGVKQSRIGRELGEGGLAGYMETKSVHVSIGSKL